MLVTIAGGAVMVLELVGSRILSPYFGGTTVIWTALIGIIMASLALGYWWGGRLADRRRDYRLLAAILAGAACWIVAIALGKEIVLSSIAGGISDTRLAACVSTVLLFGLPSFLLAAVGPYVIRMQIQELDDSGAIIGRLNAASTGGSIVGTFLAGFVLLAWMGHFKILIGLAALLFATSAACFFGSRTKAGAAAALALLLGTGAAQSLEAPRPAGAWLDIDSHYERIQVAETREPESGRPVRIVFTDIYGAQAGVYLDRPDEVLLDYQRFFRIVHHFAPNARSMLTIGGGIGTVAKDFLRTVPDGRVDVVEIDPAYITLAREHFGLGDDPRMRIFNEDGRTFVRDAEDRYDAVILDAFGSAGSVPYQLTTEEFVAMVHARMNEGAVMAVNIASAIRGDRGLLLHAMFATYEKYFDHVMLFQLDPKQDPTLTQSLSLVAVRGDHAPKFASTNSEHARRLAQRWREPIEDHETLTDDFAPVDYYFARSVF